jgi:hypothetical protein
LGENVAQLFGKTEEIGRITNPLARESGVQVCLCSSPGQSFNKFWEKAFDASQ